MDADSSPSAGPIWALVERGDIGLAVVPERRLGS